jgi:31-O-methyltransferase
MLQTTLPNNQRVFCVNPLEVPVIFSQIAPYFRHGISVKEGDTVVDVGANIGLFTLMACDWGRRAVKIFAFEPIPELFKCLKANAQSYQLQNLVPLSYVVSRERGEISFMHYPLITAMSTAYPYGAESTAMLQRGFRDILPQLPWFLRWIGRLPPRPQEVALSLLLKILFHGRRVPCQTVSLSNMFREHDLNRIDLLKIDAEMAELDILEGVDEEDWKRIRKIVIEVHDISGRLDRVMNMLRAAGFQHMVHEQDEQMKEFGVFTVYATRDA